MIGGNDVNEQKERRIIKIIKDAGFSSHFDNHIDNRGLIIIPDSNPFPKRVASILYDVLKNSGVAHSKYLHEITLTDTEIDNLEKKVNEIRNSHLTQVLNDVGEKLIEMGIDVKVDTNEQGIPKLEVVGLYGADLNSKEAQNAVKKAIGIVRQYFYADNNALDIRKLEDFRINESSQEELAAKVDKSLEKFAIFRDKENFKKDFEQNTENAMIKLANSMGFNAIINEKGTKRVLGIEAKHGLPKDLRSKFLELMKDNDLIKSYKAETYGADIKPSTINDALRVKVTIRHDDLSKKILNIFQQEVVKKLNQKNSGVKVNLVNERIIITKIETKKGTSKEENKKIREKYQRALDKALGNADPNQYDCLLEFNKRLVDKKGVDVMDVLESLVPQTDTPNVTSAHQPQQPIAPEEDANLLETTPSFTPAAMAAASRPNNITETKGISFDEVCNKIIGFDDSKKNDLDITNVDKKSNTELNVTMNPPGGTSVTAIVKKSDSGGAIYSMKENYFQPEKQSQAISQTVKLAVESAAPGTEFSIPKGIPDYKRSIIQTALESNNVKMIDGKFIKQADKPKTSQEIPRRAAPM